MRIALLLLFTMTAVGQQGAYRPHKKSAPMPKLAPIPTNQYGWGKTCAREGDTDCISVIGLTADKHGCDSSFQWDEKAQVCSVTITVSIPSAKCAFTDAEQRHITCTYKPEPPALVAAPGTNGAGDGDLHSAPAPPVAERPSHD